MNIAEVDHYQGYHRPSPKLQQWFISYWPYYCGSPASIIKKGNIRTIIKRIQKNDGTVIFFYKLS